MVSVKAIALASVISVASAQTQTLWGQCYGVTYKGPTICPSGSSCIIYNPYYGQCVPSYQTTPTPTPTTTATTASTCKTSTTTCTTVGLAVACGTSSIMSTYCSSYCATASPPRITVPAADLKLAKRCSPTTCKTTSTCSTVSLPIPCGTALITSTYCSTYCAGTTAPPRITVPVAALEKRCMPPIRTTVTSV